MPIDYRQYPKDWKAIRERVLARAERRCECVGECGDTHDSGRCNAPDRATIKRNPARPSQYEIHYGCSLCLGGDDECKNTLVILTIAHLDHDKGSDENRLLAMCQRCHLKLDAKVHAQSARRTRQQRKAVGELPGVKA